jgi:hypothetical protein
MQVLQSQTAPEVDRFVWSIWHDFWSFSAWGSIIWNIPFEGNGTLDQGQSLGVDYSGCEACGWDLDHKNGYSKPACIDRRRLNMPSIIDPETIYVDNLPGIWNPVQWELSERERAQELEDQARASLLWAVDVPEAILRLLLDEVEIERAYGPPEGFDPGMQGEWDDELITFKFCRPIRLDRVDRSRDNLIATYQFQGFGYWRIEIEPEKVTIERC